mmetsp:Transcript_34268/g.80080  ORF Transcript_34268/g.80080 Transcript_34268/m.80080 type:complete len:212 (-) Transcript_34268:1376-2011(-)
MRPIKVALSSVLRVSVSNAAQSSSKLRRLAAALHRQACAISLRDLRKADGYKPGCVWKSSTLKRAFAMVGMRASAISRYGTAVARSLPVRFSIAASRVDKASFCNQSRFKVRSAPLRSTLSIETPSQLALTVDFNVDAFVGLGLSAAFAELATSTSVCTNSVKVPNVRYFLSALSMVCMTAIASKRKSSMRSLGKSKVSLHIACSTPSTVS